MIYILIIVVLFMICSTTFAYIKTNSCSYDIRLRYLANTLCINLIVCNITLLYLLIKLIK